MNSASGQASCRIGIDIGGTKIAGVLLDDSGMELATERIAMPQHDYRRTTQAVADMIARLGERTSDMASVGIGLPGMIDGDGRVKHANATWLNGQSFATDLSELTGGDLRFANDANCFALSEATDGAGRGENVVLGVILGTGCGGGIVVNGRILAGRNGIGGELGHIPVPFLIASAEDRPEVCYCGGTDCLEQFLSGPALARRYRKMSGRELSAIEINTLADAGEPSAVRVLDEFEEMLARALASLTTILDPDVIVLGGGLSNLTRLYRNLPPLVRKFSRHGELDIAIRPPRWGDASGARGAAWLWESAFHDDPERKQTTARHGRECASLGGKSIVQKLEAQGF